MSQLIIEQIQKLADGDEVDFVKNRQHLSISEKSYVRFGHERGINFLMPIVKKLIEQRDFEVSKQDWGIFLHDMDLDISKLNAELLNLLKDKQNE